MSNLLEYTTALYRALDAAATTETVDGQEARVFRGSITRAFRNLDISSSRYSEVRRVLIDGGCMTIVRQGTKHAESIIVLHKEPDEESMVTVGTLGLTTEAEAAIVFQELQDLRRLIGSISVPDALVNIEMRLQELHNRLVKLEQQKGR